MLDNRSGIADTLRGLLAEPLDTGTQP
jgi:hypothetical protein